MCTLARQDGGLQQGGALTLPRLMDIFACVQEAVLPHPPRRAPRPLASARCITA